VKEELNRNHAYLGLFSAATGELNDMKRLINGAQLLTVQTALMFLLAVFYDLQSPSDDG
jgi:hypothetical protein